MVGGRLVGLGSGAPVSSWNPPVGSTLPADPPRRGVARLLLVRHGETEYNREGRWQGAGSDPPLNAKGRLQARMLSRQLAGRPVTVLYTSPQRRARETAVIIGSSLGLDPHLMPALGEIDHGEWEGKTQAEVLAGWPEEYRAYEVDPWSTPRPGGETYQELGERLWPALTRLADLHRGSEIVCVTHGGPIRLVLSRILERPLTERYAFGVDNASVFAVEESRGTWRLAAAS